MIVKIPRNPEELKNFLIKYIGKILPDAEADKMRELLKCKNITYQIYDKIMIQYKKVVKRGKKPQIKLDGGSKKRTKRRRKSKKRRTKKNQKGGSLVEFVLYSFAFLSLLSIAIPIISLPFILIKECHNKRKENLENQARLDTQRGWRAEEAELMSRSRPRLRGRSQLRAIRGLTKAKKKIPPQDEMEDLMAEPHTEKSAERARDDDEY